MEKETLLNGFNQRIGEPDANGMYGETGISGRTLDVYLDQILPDITDDASVNDEFYNKHVVFLKAMGGQLRHENAEFVKNYKPNTPPSTPPAPPAAGANDDLLKRLEALEKERENDKRAYAVNSLRESVAKKCEELKVSNKSLWEDSVKAVQYTDGMDELAMLEKAKQVYESKLKAYFGEGATPYGGVSTGGGNDGKKVLDNFFERKIKEGKFPRKQ